MKKFSTLLLLSLCVFFVLPVSADEQKKEENQAFNYLADKFADVQMLRLYSPDFDKLSLRQKKLCYYLSEAGLSARDIIYDQNGKHNLLIRKVLDEIFDHYQGSQDAPEYLALKGYAQLFWFNNGQHSSYGNTKIIPNMSIESFGKLMALSPDAKWPIEKGKTYAQFFADLEKFIFNANYLPVHTAKGDGKDLIKESAVNFYGDGITQKEVETYYEKTINKNDSEPIMDGLNTKLVKKDGQIIARRYARNDLYGDALSKVVFWLEKAAVVADNCEQEHYLKLLADYLKEGDLKVFRQADIAWLRETKSPIDLILGFIETYADPLGKVGSFEAVLHIQDQDASKKMAVIAEYAPWFEKNSPIMDAHKKRDIKGINFTVVNTVIGVGDSSPQSPAAINLPNNEQVRESYGSKAVFLSNIKAASNAMDSGGVLEEFSYSKEHAQRSQKYSAEAYNLKVYFHEVLGHASGQIEAGVADPSETLKTYASRNEEFRADINAVYWIADPILIKMGLVSEEEHEDLYKAAYDDYFLNGAMLQMRRIEPGKTLQQTHMANRQAIALWAYDLGKEKNVVEKKVVDGKIYFVINDYLALREIFGVMLRESQRIKSQGDFEAAKHLFETYGTHLDPEVHKQVIQRTKKFNLANFAGFINPKLVLIYKDGRLVDIQLDYTQSFFEQMREYNKKYPYLPIDNSK